MPGVAHFAGGAADELGAALAEGVVQVEEVREVVGGGRAGEEGGEDGGGFHADGGALATRTREGGVD